MRRAGTSHLIFDPENTQKPFTYMARAIGSNEIVVGFVVVERSSYENEKYYMEYNESENYGLNGVSVYLGLKRVTINPDTIVPYNQLAMIKAHQEYGYDILLDGHNLPGLRASLKIAYNERIPNDLYAPVSEKYAARYEEYGACAGVTPKRNVVEDIIENRKICKRVELLEALKKFWDEHKKDYKAILVLVGGRYTKEDCETIEEHVPGIFTHSLTGMYFENMDACIEDFVKCVDPEDIGAFDYGNSRKS